MDKEDVHYWTPQSQDILEEAAECARPETAFPYVEYTEHLSSQIFDTILQPQDPLNYPGPLNISLLPITKLVTEREKQMGWREPLVLDNDSQRILKQAFKRQRRISQWNGLERFVDKKESFPELRTSAYMETVLTRKALRETPSIHGSKKRHGPKSLSALVCETSRSRCLTLLPSPNIPQEDIDVDGLLRMRPELSVETAAAAKTERDKAVRSLVASTRRARVSLVDDPIWEKWRLETEAASKAVPRPISPPLFPASNNIDPLWRPGLLCEINKSIKPLAGDHVKNAKLFSQAGGSAITPKGILASVGMYKTLEQGEQCVEDPFSIDLLDEFEERAVDPLTPSTHMSQPETIRRPPLHIPEHLVTPTRKRRRWEHDQLETPLMPLKRNRPYQCSQPSHLIYTSSPSIHETPFKTGIPKLHRAPAKGEAEQKQGVSANVDNDGDKFYFERHPYATREQGVDATSLNAATIPLHTQLPPGKRLRKGCNDGIQAGFLPVTMRTLEEVVKNATVPQAQQSSRVSPASLDTMPNYLRLRLRSDLATNFTKRTPSSSSITEENPIAIPKVSEEWKRNKSFENPHWWVAATRRSAPTDPNLPILAGLGSLQHRALRRSLDQQGFELVEREDPSIQGADLALSGQTAVLFRKLVDLCDAGAQKHLLACLRTSSICFSRILVIFEVVPYSQNEKGRSAVPFPNPLTEPLINSISSFKRKLAISCDKENPDLIGTPSMIFALGPAAEVAGALRTIVEEELDSIRIKGHQEMASIALLEQRRWLTERKLEGEDELAIELGLNSFVSSYVLDRCNMEALKRLNHLELDWLLSPVAPPAVLERMRRLSDSRPALHRNQIA